MAGPIVVGVDGSVVGLRAVDLAVREAGLRHRPVRVVYADSCAHPPTGEEAANLGVEPRRAVQEALDRIAASSSVPASGGVLGGEPAAVLVEESRRAALVVVGHCGEGATLG